MATITRAPRREHYVSIDQRILDDESLSMEALSVLVYICSMQGTDIDALSKRFGISKDYIESVLAQIESAGYKIRGHEDAPPPLDDLSVE